MRKDTSYFDAQQYQSMPAPPGQHRDPQHGWDQKGLPQAVASSSVLPSSESRAGEMRQRRQSSRPQPMHRGMRGAVEPESDDEDGSASSASSASTSQVESYISSEEEESRVRSLTRQLAETAVGVREMSKQLGRARVKSTIQNVMIITKARDNHLIKLTRELAIWLMTTPRNGRDTGLTVYVDSQLRQSKRFDAEGIRQDYPQIFAQNSAKGQNGATSESRPSEGISRNGQNGQSGSRIGSISNGREDSLLRYWTGDMCSRSPHLFDFVVTLGGDGTVLFCSWLFQRIVPPVMPFALGSLGFLTNFDFKDYKRVLKSALDTGIRVNLRMRFTATVYRATLPSTSTLDKRRRRAIKSGKTGEIIMKSLRENGWESIETPFPQNKDFYGDDGAEAEQQRNLGEGRKPLASESGRQKKDKEVMCFSTRPVETFEVLNDLVVDRGPSPYVSLLEVFGDEHHLTTAQADGLCISTPTGSTAYSLSAGGSLVHPEIPAILISPICPHTLSFRPMLLPDSMELRIAVPYNSRSTAWASFDGRGRVELKQGDHIKVTASKYPFPTVCADNQSTDWFESISRTLKWNERQRQKSFVVVEEGGDEETSDKHAAEEQEQEKARAEAKSAAEAARKQHSSRKEDNDGDSDEGEEDEDEEDEEEEERFDIDDTSTAATRSNSPDPNQGELKRRHSTQAVGRSHHHHHHPHRSRSNEASSTPTSGSNSASSLPLFGLKPMTSMNPSAPARGQPAEPRKNASNIVSFEQLPALSPSSASPSPSSRPAVEKKYQHGVVQPTNRSLLDSPDRFGLGGPPDPPRALSERHLATADFRLDDSPDPSEGDIAAQHHTEKRPGKKDSKAASRVEGSDLRDSILSVAENKARITSGSNKLFRKLKRRSSTARRRESGKDSRPSSFDAESGGGLHGGLELDRSDSRKTGGAALVVYGQDESDSDSTAEG